MQDPAIRVERLVKVYRRGAVETRAIDDLSFAVQRGAIFGLLGPNGAGKTTTLRVLTTLARPSSGRAEIFGHDVVKAPLEVRRRIGVVIQEQAAELLLSVRDNLLTFARFHGLSAGAVRRRVEEVMEQFGLSNVRSRKVQDLSGGVRRRVQVAKMFIVDVPIVFLDEFSTGMDAILKREIMRVLRAQAAEGRTIVLTTQILSEAEELCTDILIIDHGRQLARGSVDSLKLLIDRLYEVTLGFDRIPPNLGAVAAKHHALGVTTTENTVHLKLRDDQSRVLQLIEELSSQASLARVEINGASLEDVFVELTQRGETSG
jgi:ABC-2 type transport system ATP-binding protein